MWKNKWGMKSQLDHLCILLFHYVKFQLLPSRLALFWGVKTKKIEKIQEKALRFIYQDYASSYDTLLNKFQLPSLKVRRLRAIALEAFKILSNQTPVYLYIWVIF